MDVVQLPGSDDTLQQLEFAEEMVVDLLTYLLGFDVGEELIRKWGFRICEELRRTGGKFIEICISSLISSIKTLQDLSAALHARNEGLN